MRRAWWGWCRRWGGIAALQYRGPDGYPLRFSHLLTGLVQAEAFFRFDSDGQAWEAHIIGAPDFVQDFGSVERPRHCDREVPGGRGRVATRRRFPDDPLDDVSLGRLFERANQPERSMLHYGRAVEAGVTGGARRCALKALADQHKRRGDLDDARALWHELTDENTLESVYALHELAMVAEHRDGDFNHGVELCDRALTRLDENYELSLAFRVKWRDAFTHRRQRLERRLHTAERPGSGVTENVSD